MPSVSSQFPLTNGQTTQTAAPDWFAARLARQFPAGWASGDALSPGGNLYALFKAQGVGLTLILQTLLYALDSSRFDTATAPELDLAAQDFGVQARSPGESDAAYAAYITANLFQPLVTRAVVTAAAVASVPSGAVVRVIEPWYIPDVGCVDGSYVDSDSASVPGRVGGPYPYFGIIEVSMTGTDSINLSALAAAVERVKAYGTLVWVADSSGATEQ